MQVAALLSGSFKRNQPQSENKVTITQGQANFLKEFLAEYASILQEARINAKQEAGMFYAVCDKEDSNSSKAFQCLNDRKDLIRYTKKKEKAVNSVIRALKKSSK